MRTWKRLIEVLAAMELILPGSWARGQVFTASDVPIMADMVVAGANPIDPELTAFWQVVHSQQEIHGQVFGSTWTSADLVLPLSETTFVTGGLAVGATASGEVFHLEVVFASLFNMEDVDLLPEVEQQFLASDFQWAAVVGWLSSTQGAASVMGHLISSTSDGQRHDVLLLTGLISPVDMELFEWVEAEASRALPSVLCTTADGEPLDLDTLAEHCLDLALIDFDRERSRLKKAALIYNVFGWPGSIVGCVIAIPALGGAPGVVVCAGLFGTMVAADGCLVFQMATLRDDYRFAQECCCAGLRCRTQGEPNCPPDDCRLPNNAGNAPCIPFL